MNSFLLTKSILMKNLVLPLFCIILVFGLFLSCKKKPVACISESSMTVNINEIVRFTSCSENATITIWEINGFSPDMGILAPGWLLDGGTGCDNFMEFEFTSKGTHTVALKAANLIDGHCSCGYCEYKNDDKVSISVTVN